MHLKNLYLNSKKNDAFFIILPSFMAIFLTFILVNIFKIEKINFLLWLFVDIVIDSSHVFSTLFISYFSKPLRNKFAKFFVIIPLISLLVCFILFNFNQFMYIKFLIYMVAFHSVRQHYGIFKLYENKTQLLSKYHKIISTLTIYSSTIFPIIYWHTHLKKSGWYGVESFFYFNAKSFYAYSEVTYIILICLYLCFEINLYRKHNYFHLQKNLYLAGVALSWYYGIVIMDDPITFHIINNLTHSIPYMALTWDRSKKINSSISVMLFFTVIIGLGILVNFTNDILLSKTHLSHLIKILISDKEISWIVPILGSIGITHYLLDAFLWKKNNLIISK